MQGKGPTPFQAPNYRPDLPTYPVHLQLLRVTAMTVAGPAGYPQSGAPGSSILAGGYYVSFTQQRRTDSGLPQDREPCLVQDVNALGLTPGFYLGRLAGSWTSLPVYEVTNLADTADTFLVHLTAKCYTDASTGCPSPTDTPVAPSDRSTDYFIVYSWTRVNDTDGDVPRLDYDNAAQSGGPGSNPLYHVRDLDLPVGGNNHPLSIVRVWKGQGSYYLFDTEPHVDLFRTTSAVDADGTQGFRRYWDQNDNTWKDGEEVRVVLAE